MATLWIFNQFAVSPDMPGGTRHYDFGSELVKKGYEVYIFASDFSLQELKFKKLSESESYKVENINGVNFVWVRTIPYKTNNYRRLLNQFAFAINVFSVSGKFKKPDVIIGSSPQLLTAFAGYLRSLITKSKFIVEIRDLWPESLIVLQPSAKHNPYVWLLYLISSILYKRSKEIVVFTEENRELISKKGITEEKIHFIPNGINTDTEVNKENAGKLKRELRIEKFTIAYAGSIGVANNIEMMVDVAEKLRNETNIEIVVIGDGPKRKTIETMIENKKLNNIRMLNPLPKNEIFDFLSLVDVCFITLADVPLFRYGVSPNKLFDYMFAGKPIIASVGGWTNEQVIKASCGIAVQPNSVDEFVNAVKKLKETSIENRKEMGSRGKEFVKRHFSRKNLVIKLEEIIK